MIELSLGKMVLLALIALIVLGPEKLPGAARTAGALLRRVRSGWDNVRAEVERELEIEEIRRSAREAVAGAEAAQKQVKDGLKQAHDPFAQAAAMVKLSKPVAADTPSTSNAAPPDTQAVSEQASSAASANPLPENPPTKNESPVTDERHAHSHDAANELESEARQAELPLDEPQGNTRFDEGTSHGHA